MTPSGPFQPQLSCDSMIKRTLLCPGTTLKHSLGSMFDISLRGETLTLISFLTADDVAIPNGICKEKYLMSDIFLIFFFFY